MTVTPRSRRETAEAVAKPQGERRIDRGERLVAKEQARAPHQRAGDAYALALAAGEVHGARGRLAEQADFVERRRCSFA